MSATNILFEAMATLANKIHDFHGNHKLTIPFQNPLLLL